MEEKIISQDSGNFYPSPSLIQMEMTEGCNRRCSFCGIHSLYRDKIDIMYKFMTIETASKISKDLNDWLSEIRIEFALQGEPLLNKNAALILQTFRREFDKCQLQVTSNMDPLRKGPKGFSTEKISLLFKSGLNILVADYYGETFDMSYHEFLKGLKEASNGLAVYDFYEDKVNPWTYYGNDGSMIVAIDNTHERNEQRLMNNQAGNTSPELIKLRALDTDIELLPRLERCQQPFREMFVKYDGAVPFCCMDWNREHIIGKFPEEGSFKEIWNKYHLNLIRKLLYEGRRDLLAPCNRCNYKGNELDSLVDPFNGADSDLQEISSTVKIMQANNLKYANRHATQPFKY
jgi:MoaA/NifB/PqqE/SkfB family radical SAM enzyme